MGRLIVRILLVCIVLAVAGVLYLWNSLDALVARRIEQEGTRVLGAPVRVAGVDLSLREGTGRIRDLRVGNPEGFGDEEAFTLEEITIQVDLDSLTGSPVRLRRVDVETTAVNLEIDEVGRSNLDAIARHAREAPKDGGGEQPMEEQPERRIAIERLHFAGGAVSILRPGIDEPDRVELPGFDRSDVGGAQGATGGEIANVFVQALTRQVAASAAGREVERAVKEKLGGAAGEAAGSVVRGLLGD
jgi:uncharacterized protein involved in outer membrane biogenesis